MASFRIRHNYSSKEVWSPESLESLKSQASMLTLWTLWTFLFITAFFQCCERGPARIDLFRRTVALLLIQIHAAGRAQPLTLFATQAARRQGQQQLLAYQLVHVNTLISID